MKRSRFYIRLDGGAFQEVEGKVGQFFGMDFGCHKDQYGWYCITHLPTGAKVITEDKMKDAVDAITEDLCDRIRKTISDDEKWRTLEKEMSKFKKANPIGGVE